MNIIDISAYSDDILPLERAHYEVTARQNIIQFMMTQNMKTNSLYQEYWEEYLMYLKAYSILKQQFINTIINKLIKDDLIAHDFQLNNNTEWTVDFFKKELQING